MVTPVAELRGSRPSTCQRRTRSVAGNPTAHNRSASFSFHDEDSRLALQFVQPIQDAPNTTNIPRSLRRIATGLEVLGSFNRTFS